MQRTGSFAPAGAFAKSALRLAGAGILAVALAGCSMGSMFGGTGSDAQFANAYATQAEIAEGAPTSLPAIATECPPIRVRPGTEALFFYGSGRVGNPQSLVYQAVIDQATRNCIVSNGLIRVDMGVAGRLLLGPSGSQTSVDLPIRFAVERDGQAVFSERYEVQASINPPDQSGEFVHRVDGVSIPYLGGEQITIWVGFDSAR
jgi:hypothetical protein